MLSSKNLSALVKAGDTYIVGSRLHKIPHDIAEYQKTQELTDNQIITTQLNGNQRIIYQYRGKRAQLDMRNIVKQITKSEKIVNGKLAVHKAKFLRNLGIRRSAGKMTPMKEVIMFILPEMQPTFWLI